MVGMKYLICAGLGGIHSLFLYGRKQKDARSHRPPHNVQRLFPVRHGLRFGIDLCQTMSVDLQFIELHRHLLPIHLFPQKEVQYFGPLGIRRSVRQNRWRTPFDL